MTEFFADYSKLLLTIIVIVLVVLIFSVVIGRKVAKLKVGDKPGKVTSLVIQFIGWFNNFVKQNIGRHWKYVAPLVLTLGVTIFLSNIAGLFGLDTPTKYTAVTLAFSLFAVFTIQTTGIVSRKWRHMKTWVGPMPIMAPIMVPLNIISDFTPLISMTLRLFGNIASGGILISLVYEGLFQIHAVAGALSFIPAAALHIIFDFGFGAIQTLVFVLLTIIFSSNKVEDSDLEILLYEGEMLND